MESVFNKAPDLRACNFMVKKLQHRCFPVNFTKFFRIPILKSTCERLLQYFLYNSHHHFDYYHFHYHCKMHLYHLRILLTIPLDCSMIPSLFHLNFVFFLPVYIFLQSYSKLFHFLRPVKGLRIRLRTPENFQMLSLQLCFIYSYLHFLICT